MKIESLKPTTVEELIAILQQFPSQSFITILADGSSSFPEDGVWVEDVTDTEVAVGADF